MSVFARNSTANANPELTDIEQFRVDSRRFSTRLAELIATIAPLGISLFGILCIVMPEYGDVFVISASITWLLKNRSRMEFPLDAPEWSHYITKREKFSSETIRQGRLIPRFESGTASIIYGWEYIRMRLIGVNPDKETRHTLIIGSTGSGKTVLILAMLLQVLLQPGGTSAVIVDGKADIQLFWKIFAMLKRVDRLHDLLVLNFLSPTDCLDTNAVHDDQKISNNMNFLNYGYPDQLKNMTMGLGRAPSGGDGDFWQGRTSTMIGASYQYLVYERDVEGIPLDITALRAFLPLRVMLEKAARQDVPLKYRLPLQQYLKSLPMISDAHFEMTKQEIATFEIYPKTDEQHIYNLMMVNETISDLSETMSHIFVTELSEVNMTDVCLGGRVLLCLLPAIAKNADQVAALGRLILAGLRPVLAAAAGYNLQGDRFERIDNRPSSAKYPVRIFLDEYGMYGVAGFFVLAALVRSYGFHLIFGAQTAGMFKRAGGEEEYEALMGNLNSKIVLKNEDPKESLALVQGRTGKVWVAKQDRIERNLFGAEHDNDDVRLTETDMVSARALASAAPGEGFFIYGGDVLPFKALYLSIPDVDTARLNYFSAIRKPNVHEIDRLKRVVLNRDKEFIQEANDYFEKHLHNIELPELANKIAEIKSADSSYERDEHMTMILALGLIELEEMEFSLVEDVADSTDPLLSEVMVQSESLEDGVILASDPEMQINFAHEGYEPDFEWFPEIEGSEMFSDFIASYDGDQEMDSDASDTMSNYQPCSELEFDDYMTSGRQAGILSERLVMDEDSEDPLDIYNALSLQMVEQFDSANLDNPMLMVVKDEANVTIDAAIASTGVNLGYTQEEADSSAAQVVSDIKKALLFPRGDLPRTPNKQEVDEIIRDTLSALSGKF
ncbi:hypothetical protein FG475_20500 [Vibrio navarrensis]|nr:hypothetical protein [Vibrio navarrensis]